MSNKILNYYLIKNIFFINNLHVWANVKYMCLIKYLISYRIYFLHHKPFMMVIY